MYYPSQTSLIPVQIALARFLEDKLGELGVLGLLGNLGNYPYWYLGTTPFRYLTGPVLPALLIIAHKFFPSLDLFEIFWLVLGTMWVIGGIGVYLLVSSLAKPSTSERLFVSIVPPSEESIRPPRRRDLPRGVSAGKPGLWAIGAAFFYLFGPIVPFLFRFSNGASIIAFSVLPWILAGWLKKWGDKGDKGDKGNRRDWGILAGMVLVILIDASIIPTMVLGIIAVALSIGGYKNIEKKIKQLFYALLFTFIISSLWYTPFYWFRLLFAPSFSGKPLIGVISQIGQLLPITMAIGLAVVSSKLIKFKNQLSINNQQSTIKFSFYWLFIFGFLTVLRFIADPDFWLDWSSYGIELQLGLGILGGILLGRLGRLGRLGGLGGGLMLFALIFNRQVLGTLQKDISKTVEYRVGKWLEDKADKGDRVFMSGSAVFWINAFFDVSQVRGGNDNPSVDPNWRGAVWEVREGSDPQKSIEALEKLGVDYLVVHTKESEEYWHDFKFPEKFENVKGLKKVYDNNGNRIYDVNFYAN